MALMDGTFFVPKNVILKWLNDTFEIGYTKIEQAASGAIHCQILDAVFPGQVPLHKVNFDAKFDYEYVQNYKILQNVFTKMEVPKHVEVERLIKGKYQDNLEFLQWMKSFFDGRYNGAEYSGRERREAAMAQYRKGRPGGASGAAGPSAGGGAGLAKREKKEAVPAGKPAAPKKPSGVAAPPAKKPAGGAKPSAPAAASAGNNKSGELAELREQVSRMNLTIEGLEKERNFYFGKLREIEILCQTDESVEASTKQQVLKILYHTDPEDEFQSPADATAPAEEAEVPEEELTY